MLSGLHVLECCDESGSLAGKILGDLGADVVKLEPPGGDRVARRAPYLGGVIDPERSLSWLALNTSKRGITLDTERASGRAAFARLLGWADVLLDTFAPGTLAEWGLGDADLARRHPRLVRCAITPFGQTGPYANFRGGDLVVVAMGGAAAAMGDPDRPPVRCTMPVSYYHAAPEAVLGILLALHAREHTGRGQLVDVSLHECQVGALVGAPALQGTGAAPPHRSGARRGATRSIWPARDGWIAFDLDGAFDRAECAASLRALVAWMHECSMAPAWLRAIDWDAASPGCAGGEETARVEAALGAFFASLAVRELCDGAQARRIALAPCHDARAVLGDPRLRERGLFTTLEYPQLGAAIEHPACFARTSGEAIGIRSRAPRIGEHNDAVFREAGFDGEETMKLAAEGAI